MIGINIKMMLYKVKDKFI